MGVTNGTANAKALSRELGAVFSAQLKGSGSVKVVAPGSFLWRTGDLVSELPIVKKGSLEAVVRISAGALQIVPTVFSYGEVAGLSLVFSRDPVQFDLVAPEPVVIRWVPLSLIEESVLQNQVLLAVLSQFLAIRLREAQQRERSWLERSVHARVRSTLSRIVREVECKSPTTTVKVTHERLAMRCGISRPKLSRELKLLESLGALRLDRGAIEVLDLLALGT
ncbi:CRP-like cAMP-binding protein [Variovorax paradoxus]|uniref:Crp/Fnr family transcriptional regulator n=1 Tax=Variovorax paradoxus TaxID=34073 RepID=UPI00278B9A22|nr:Crp/Fnr family transcriptional regulator [Variovorax paradoxus]MDP9962954.1 CRP-like cAMP-binding protein [Variovorax paradoxus]